MSAKGFMRLDHAFVRSQQVAALTANGKALLLAMADRYNGSNNGGIPYSVREVTEWLHCSKRTAIRALAELKSASFIEPIEIGSFKLKAGARKGAATTWRLTFINTGKTEKS